MHHGEPVAVGALAGQLEVLEVVRVVQVDDHHRVRGRDRREVLQHAALHDPHVGAAEQVLDVVDVAYGETTVTGPSAGSAGDERDLVLHRQRRRELPGPDRGPGHLRAEDVTGGDDDAPPAHEVLWPSGSQR
jgi:hypothetical protein